MNPSATKVLGFFVPLWENCTYMKDEGFTIEKLEDFTRYFYEVRKACITDANAIYLDDFFYNAIVIRAYQINKGFLALYNTDNLISAAPLVRLQLETVCRCFGVQICDLPETYIHRFMEGKKVDNQTHNGKQLVYGYLIELLSNTYDATELKRIYDEGNVTVHPSEKAFRAANWATTNPDVSTKIELKNLESKIFTQKEKDALYQDMLYVNLCYLFVLQNWIELKAQTEAEPKGEPEEITDPEAKARFEGQVNRIWDAMKRE